MLSCLCLFYLLLMQQFGRKSSCLLVFRGNSALKKNQLGLGSKPTVSHEVQLPNHHHVVLVFLIPSTLWPFKDISPLKSHEFPDMQQHRFLLKNQPMCTSDTLQSVPAEQDRGLPHPFHIIHHVPTPNDTTCGNSKGSTGVCVDACLQACSHHMQVTSGLATYEPPTHTHTHPTCLQGMLDPRPLSQRTSCHFMTPEVWTAGRRLTDASGRDQNQDKTKKLIRCSNSTWKYAPIYTVINNALFMREMEKATQSESTKCKTALIFVFTLNTNYEDAVEWLCRVACVCTRLIS